MVSVQRGFSMADQKSRGGKKQGTGRQPDAQKRQACFRQLGFANALKMQ